MGQWRRQGRDNQELSVKIVDRQIGYQTDDDDDDDDDVSLFQSMYVELRLSERRQ